jgi:hypothetical protein
MLLDGKTIEQGGAMVARAGIAVLALAIALGLPLAGLATAKSGADDGTKAAIKREDDAAPLVTADDDDDDGDDTGGNTDRTGKSRDRTNSRHTAVSRDRDRSRGDLTRDKTRDGKGGKKRDWSQNRTNDGSRNDTR